MPRYTPSVLMCTALTGMLLTFPATAAGDSWSVAVGVGQASADFDANTPSGIQTDDSDTSMHLGLGYHLNDNFSVAVEYIDLGEGEASFTADTTDPDSLQALNVENVPVLGSGISVTASYAFYNSGNIKFSGIAGLYNWEADLDSDANGNALDAEVDGTDLTLGVDFQYRVQDNISSYLRLQRYQLSPNDVNEIHVGIAYSF